MQYAINSKHVRVIRHISGGLENSIFLWDLNTLANLTSTNNTITSRGRGKGGEWRIGEWMKRRGMGWGGGGRRGGAEWGGMSRRGEAPLFARLS